MTADPDTRSFQSDPVAVAHRGRKVARQVLRWSLGLSLLCSGFGAAAQADIESYRAEAKQRLNSEIERLEALRADTEVLARLAHAKFFLGNVTTDRDTALTLYQFGLSHANAALKLRNDNHAARLWSVVNTLKIFEITRPLRALWMMDDLEEVLLELKVIEVTFQFAAPDRVLAVLYAESPAYLVGSSKKAEQHFRAALELNPDFPANTLLYAAFLLDQDRAVQAKRLLSQWTGQDRLADFPLYEMIWRMDLLKLRQRLGN